MFHDHYWGSPMMWFIWLPIVLIIIFAAIRMNTFSGRENTPPKDSAMDTLKKRYAKGEITKEEFEKIKEDLLK